MPHAIVFAYCFFLLGYILQIGEQYRCRQSWARVPAGPSRDACPRSFISSSRSACFFKAFFSRTKIRVLAFQI